MVSDLSNKIQRRHTEKESNNESLSYHSWKICRLPWYQDTKIMREKKTKNHLGNVVTSRCDSSNQNLIAFTTSLWKALSERQNVQNRSPQRLNPLKNYTVHLWRWLSVGPHYPSSAHSSPSSSNGGSLKGSKSFYSVSVSIVIPISPIQCLPLSHQRLDSLGRT